MNAGFLSNAHTHTPYCDGRSSIAELIETARRLGFASLGFSGHAEQGFDLDYSMADGKQALYFDELRALQAAGGSPRLWVGLEADGMADEAMRRESYARADYVIGSTHYLCRDYRGASVGVDADPTLLRAYADDVFGGDGLLLARAYFDAHVDYLLRDRPDIIGHFDLVRKHAARIGLFDENSAAYRRLALDALERAFASGGVLELNTGGVARGHLDAPYPTRELLGAWRELGGRVTLTSDCHDCRYLDCWFDQAIGLARSVGYTSLMRLGTGDALWEEWEIGRA